MGDGCRESEIVTGPLATDPCAFVREKQIITAAQEPSGHTTLDVHQNNRISNKRLVVFVHLQHCEFAK